jgi:hypothetical protein
MRALLVAWLLPALAAVAAEPEATFKVGDFTFTRPAKWESVQPGSSMRKAQLRVPGDKAQPTDVIFFHFGPGDGGGTQANIDRWLMQFRDAKNKNVNDKTVGKRKVTYVSTEGTYSGGMPGQPSAELKEHALLGAIAESPNGNVFIKMTGPVAAVKAAEGDFRGMVEGALK